MVVPDPDSEGQVRSDVMTARCNDCDEMLGPDLAEEVSRKLSRKHRGHDTEILDEWTEMH